MFVLALARILAVSSLLALGISQRALADGLEIGGGGLVGGATHKEPDYELNSPVGDVLVVLDAKSGRFELHAEHIPAIPPINIANGPTGIQTIQLSFIGASIRYWFVPSRWAIGAGETLWNQQTKYFHSYTPQVEYDASRGAGTRYVLVNNIPIWTDSVETELAISPRVHARLSWVYSPPYSQPPVSEQESQIEVTTAWVHKINSRFQLKAGLHYINLTAKYDDGSSADSNSIIVGFGEVLYYVVP